MIFHAFTDKELRKRFAIIVKKDEVSQLIDYLDRNNVKCRWLTPNIPVSTYLPVSKLELQEQLLQSIFLSHPSALLYFYHDNEDPNGLTFSVDTVDYISDKLIRVYCLKDILNEQHYAQNSYTKDKLADRMVVELANGHHYMVCGDVLINDEFPFKLSNYNNDLTHSIYSELNIVKIYSQVDRLSQINDKEWLDRNLMWSRDSIRKKMKLSEIEEELGYKIEIVEE